MTHRSRIHRWGLRALGALVAVALAIAAWWGAERSRGRGAAPSPPADRAAAPVAAGATAASHAHARAAAPALLLAERPGGEVAITGRVIEVQQQQPVGSVELVFRGAAGDATTSARRDGSYAIRLAPGTYRAFVRDDTVMSLGRRDPVRLPGPPPVEIAGVPDEALMTAVVATRDRDGVDLSVVRGGIVTGHVIDGDGRPIRGAVVHAVGGGLRPTLATDIARSGPDGGFELRLPPGTFELVASHPRFAGVSLDSRTRYAVGPGGRADATLVMAAGCVISGRVIASDGERAGDGALERQWGQGEFEFAPTGRIDPDGEFRWATTEDGEVRLRAWPWRSPPSPVRRFACRDGARFDGVVFRLPEQRPDLEGVLVDRAGHPIGFAFLDLRPLDPGGVGQQERSDGSGRWAVYRVPPGRYRIVAQADGLGIATTTVVSPRDGIRLELGGTGRLAGTTPRLASGSFELVLDSCTANGDQIALPQSRRLVTVTGGRFAADDLPACELSLAAVWRGRPLAQHVAIPAGGTARIELALGEPRKKMVRGSVRDAAGEPIAGAVISVVRPEDESQAATAVSDAAGRYTIQAFSGARLGATTRGRIGYARVGGADVSAEQVDIAIGDAADGADPRD